MTETGLAVLAHGTVTADGTEQNILDSSVAGVFSGWLDLTNMQAGDTLVVKQYQYIEGAKILFATMTYSGAQSPPALEFSPTSSTTRVIISIQQTAGTNRDYKYNFDKEVIMAQVDIISDAAPFAGARIASTPAFETAVETSIVMDGDEKTLVEKTDSKHGLLDGLVNLSVMGASDTIIIRQYMKNSSGGAYEKYAEQSYSGVQSIPLVVITTKTSKTSIKVTAQQTAKDGGYKTLDVQFFRRLTA